MAIIRGLRYVVLGLVRGASKPIRTAVAMTTNQPVAKRPPIENGSGGEPGNAIPMPHARQPPAIGVMMSANPSGSAEVDPNPAKLDWVRAASSLMDSFRGGQL